MTPTYDRCPYCGREGRTMVKPDSITNLVGSGNRALPLRGLELEIATHVGAATLKAGELDAAMGGLSAVAGPPDAEAFRATWGRSGTELTTALRKIAASADVDADVRQEVDRLCARYDALYGSRNDLIHSFRTGHGSDRLEVIRAIRIKKSQPLPDASDMSDRRRLGMSEIVDLYYDTNDLFHDVRDLFFRVIGAVR
ncbi:hypothetical protein [Aeromicrobium sp. 179-A 4D2 NHS]|uniref:hypothetical protein n=1 Tax=Aeromicrobium sp. 179-A 4D2 NHS TaxID=3142375 RepID=UPI0039A34460